jgi:hypothetical protein
MRRSRAVSIDDGDLAIGVVGIARLEHLHDARRAEALGEQLERQRVVAAIDVGLRLGDADAGQIPSQRPPAAIENVVIPSPRRPVSRQRAMIE